MQAGPPRRRRGRPVADAPIDALLQRVEDLAKGWLMALLEQLPLEAAPAILAADFARDGPRVCDAVVRALASDQDLRRIERGGPLEPLISRAGSLSGVRDPQASSRAVDALHAVIWSALRDELPRPEPDQVAELAERLALVVEQVREAALRAPLRDRTAAEHEGEPAAPAGEPAPVVVDMRGAEPGGSEPHDPASSQATLWARALDDEILQARSDGARLSLLLAELEDADRVSAVESDAEASATFSRFAQAVRSALRRQDILACESESRAWIIARETGRAGANALASRLAGAVRSSPAWHGAPLGVSVGVAVLGEDGGDRHALIEAAEEARFAASAAGLEVGPP
jgi:GGDEF domain-containing protein